MAGSTSVGKRGPRPKLTPHQKWERAGAELDHREFKQRQREERAWRKRAARYCGVMLEALGLLAPCNTLKSKHAKWRPDHKFKPGPPEDL